MKSVKIPAGFFAEINMVDSKIHMEIHTRSGAFRVVWP